MMNKVNDSVDVKPIKHKVEYMKKEERLQRVYDIIQKHLLMKEGGFPIAIYSEIRTDIDDLREYLRLKEVKKVVCMHSGMSTDQRKEQTEMLPSAKVLILSDFVIKGMDLGQSSIVLTINYDIPNEFETVLKRLARMRRGYCAGQSKIGKEKHKILTFVHKNSKIEVLEQMKSMLIANG